MSRRRKIVTHWTAHACLAADPTSPRPSPRPTWLAIENDSGRTRPFADMWIGCDSRRRKPLDPATNRYTCRIAEVTCTWCREQHGRMVLVTPYEPDAAWMSVRARLQAHATCCRDRGAPMPVDASELSRFAQRQAARRFREVFVLARMSMVGGDPREAIERAAESLSPEVRDIVRPALDELTMAADLMEEAQRMQSRAMALVDAFAAQIIAGDGPITIAPAALLEAEGLASGAVH